jgi:hypothetical protein
VGRRLERRGLLRPSEAGEWADADLAGGMRSDHSYVAIFFQPSLISIQSDEGARFH